MALDALPNTQTPADLTPDTSNLLHPPAPIWGRLLSTIKTLKHFDLVKSSCSLGRDPNCDIVITDKVVSATRVVQFSKEHFIIEQGDDNLVYIKDISRNGTFVNKKMIGRNNKCILQNDDEIAVCLIGLRVFVFKSMTNLNQAYLPSGLRGKYEVSRLLGAGACGEVKLVFEKHTIKPFACKRILKSKGSKKFNHPENIQKEINILCKLDYPFIITVKDVEQTPNAYYIIMEYMEGGELSSLIHSPKRLTEAQVKFLFYQIVLAVEYLHDRNIVHRDLKPENILLKNYTKDDNMVKISDFGLSKMVSEQSLMRTLCGTPYFAAPEILDPHITTYGRKVDVWSLGVILYYMLSQVLPFRAPSTAALGKVILTGKYSMSDPLWSEITSPAKDLIKAMLARNANKRIDINRVVEHPWFTEDRILIKKIDEILYRNFKTRKLEPDSDGSEDERETKRLRLAHNVVETPID